MKITHFGGVEECNSIEELHTILKKRYGNNANEFWISCGEKFPYLGMMVKDKYAYIQYFPDEDSAGFVGMINNNDPPLEEIVIFYTNTINEEIEVFNEMVVPFSKAEEVIVVFYNNSNLLEHLKWNAL